MKQSNKAFFLRYLPSFTLFLGILFAAGFFRLTNLDLIEFKTDEALNLFLATRPIFGHPFPPASIASSIGVLNFPLLNYLLFPIVSISWYPPVVSGVIAFVNTLSLGAFFLLVKRYFSTTTAIIASLLFAFSPWAIIYSRKIWAEDFIIPLVISLLFCFFKLYKEKKLFYWLPYTLIGLFLLQIHQTTGILPLLLSIFLISKVKPNWLYIFSGLCMGFLPTIPFFWYEISQKCPDCSILFSAHNRLVTFHPDIFLRPFQIITTGSFHTFFGSDIILLATQYSLLYRFMNVSYLMYIILPVAFYLFWKKWKEYRMFLVVTCLIPFIFFIVKIDSLIHYLIVTMPFLFLFLGDFFATLIKAHQRIIKLLGILLITLFLILFISLDTTFFHLLRVKGGLGGDYGATFATEEKTTLQEFAPYKNSIHYKEMIVASSAGLEELEGSQPVGRMLFPEDATRTQIPSLEQDLKRIPINPLDTIPLLTFYTYPDNSRYNTLVLLKKKSQRIPAYAQIYALTYDEYVTLHHIHIYSSSDFSFSYPEHWKQQEVDDAVSFSDGYTLLTIKRGENSLPIPSDGFVGQPSKVPLAGYLATIQTCFEGSTWCGNYIPSATIGANTYSLSFSPVHRTPQDTTEEDIVTQDRKVFNQILASFTTAR